MYLSKNSDSVKKIVISSSLVRMAALLHLQTVSDQPELFQTNPEPYRHFNMKSQRLSHCNSCI